MGRVRSQSLTTKALIYLLRLIGAGGPLWIGIQGYQFIQSIAIINAFVVPIELRYILFSSFLKRWKQELSSIGFYIAIVVDQAIFIY